MPGLLCWFSLLAAGRARGAALAMNLSPPPIDPGHGLAQHQPQHTARASAARGGTRESGVTPTRTHRASGSHIAHS